MGLNLLEKTELWVNHIKLDHVNLTQLAQTVADVLGIESSKVLVVDVRPDHITLDIMENDIPTENIVGKERVLLDALSKLEGVHLTEESFIHSNGILGLICLEGENPLEMSRTVNHMVDEMKERIAKRAIIFPTGFELKQNLIEDTNTPYLKQLLEAEGYKVTIGDIMEDDLDDMEYKLSDAISRAFGLIITTGGVGAEDKDKTVESMLRIDPQAATPYIVKFQRGTGRHVKDGVRIAVGTVGPSMLVSFPGPNDEVRLAAGVLLECLKNNCGKEVAAQKIAAVLAEKLMKKGFHHEHHE
ncbi:molybdopterin-binding protein [Sporomusa acidovorans]|uniref:Competence-damage inducible protein n=1 Tax=Sporomusa acidovorans (strain ATCC 49682 / DSM 3132 / Mol) TaxID=1123286 RepID=A0ABZ3J5Q7_SPOA4|nr:molybdopterin-binding protein [Sporomusa acidovorans]OZC15602.1 putative competence-damage inducible protein [Sporomusa acidovorans DSM 3132]SDE19367.1 Probable molybdopterin binding domain-containing protein [Sporomusa acidovorans]